MPFNMKKNQTLWILSFVILGGIILLSNASGALPEHTGAPDEDTCGIPGCHGVTPNQGNAKISIDFSDTSNVYAPGETYTVMVSITGAQNAEKNGFQIVALDSLNKNIGEWILKDANLTRLRNGAGSLSDRRYVTHTNDGNKQSSWQINWKAGENYSGAVTFYLAVLDANGNNTNGGDMVYTTNKTVTTGTVSSVNYLDRGLVDIFPNPASEIVYFRNKSDVQFESYGFYDLSGKLVASGLFTPTVSVNQLTKGMYIVRLVGNEGILTSKLMVN